MESTKITVNGLLGKTIVIYVHDRALIGDGTEDQSVQLDKLD